MKRIRPIHLKFIEEYIRNGGNARKAYMVVYEVTNNDVADVSASRLLSNVRIKQKLESLMMNEIDVNSVIATLQRKLDNHAETPKFSREELMAMRLALEYAQKVGGKGVNVNLNFHKGETCPTCGFRQFDISELKTLPKIGTEQYQKIDTPV